MTTQSERAIKFPERLDDRYIVVSADSHVGPPMEAYRPYCPASHRDRFDEQLAAVKASRSRGRFGEITKQILGYEIDSESAAAADRASDVEGGIDATARHRDMDAEGVAADVIFHGLQTGEPMPFVGDQLFLKQEVSAETDAIGCHMYNQWLVDFIDSAPARHAGIAHVSFLDVEGAIRELEWARQSGLSGVNLPAPRRGSFDLTSPELEPFFAACADLGVTLTTHAGAGDRWRYDDGVLGRAFGIIEGPFVARRGVWHLIFSGVFERYPSLKLVMTELFGIWVPEMLRDLDFAYLDRGNAAIRTRLPRLPSEYWTTNCYAAASFMARDEAALFPDHGASNLMWGSDYPHTEGTYPYTRDSLRNTFAGLPSDAVAPMVGLTAVEVYGMDVGPLRDIADRIGPTVTELSTPPSTRPGDDYRGLGFRDSASWPADAAR